MEGLLGGQNVCNASAKGWRKETALDFLLGSNSSVSAEIGRMLSLGTW